MKSVNKIIFHKSNRFTKDYYLSRTNPNNWIPELYNLTYIVRRKVFDTVWINKPIPLPVVERYSNSLLNIISKWFKQLESLWTK